MLLLTNSIWSANKYVSFFYAFEEKVLIEKTRQNQIFFSFK